jgi:hypothetical protein
MATFNTTGYPLDSAGQITTNNAGIVKLYLELMKGLVHVLATWSCRGGPTYARSRRDPAIPIAPGRTTEIDGDPALNTRPRSARKCK